MASSNKYIDLIIDLDGLIRTDVVYVPIDNAGNLERMNVIIKNYHMQPQTRFTHIFSIKTPSGKVYSQKRVVSGDSAMLPWLPVTRPQRLFPSKLEVGENICQYMVEDEYGHRDTSYLFKIIGTESVSKEGLT